MNGVRPACALSARRLSVDLGVGPARHTVLHELTVDIRAGAWTCLVGPNGAGKSTLLRALAGLQAFEGEVQLLGRSLSAWPARERAQSLAWLAQGGVVDRGADDLTVLDVALLGRLPHQGWLGAPSARDHAAAEQALRQTQAWDWRCRPLGALSGGERQRVLLARLLAVEAPVMLMDEPLAHLDPPHQADWIALVRELVAAGRTVVSVLHEISLALMADDVLVLRDGRLSHAGPAHDPAAHAALLQAFDGRLAIVHVDGHWVALPR
jgi:iron complex transport system ATP-binding protein